jgi:hypothetical protein
MPGLRRPGAGDLPLGRSLPLKVVWLEFLGLTSNSPIVFRKTTSANCYRLEGDCVSSLLNATSGASPVDAP